MKDFLLELENNFKITTKQVKEISLNFTEEIEKGLMHKESSLTMLPSFLKSPNGKEKGEFLTIDFGGTNLRILRVKLNGNRDYEILEKKSYPLRDPLKTYDYTSVDVDAKKLFDFIALKVKEVSKNITKNEIFLGHTFSFPCSQDCLDKACLIKWTKEIETSGVEGNDISILLQDALNAHELHNIKQAAIINDTVATLLVGAYQYPNVNIGSICGTGHNTCYLEKDYISKNNQMIINLESGNFNKLSFTKYDQELDLKSEKPGLQILEKMASGHYLGEIFRLITKDIFTNYEIKKVPPFSIYGSDLAILVLNNSSNIDDKINILTKKVGFNSKQINTEIINLSQKIADLLIKRSAKLVSASFLGIIHKTDKDLTKNHVIAIDGSLYEKMPYYSEYINQTFFDVLGNKASLIETKLIKDGSGVGAAIAASLAAKNF